MNLRPIAGALTLLWVCMFSDSVAANPAEKVSTARALVDSLAERLERQRRASRDDVAALRSERAELRRQVRLERVRRDTLARLRSERTKRVDNQQGRIALLLQSIQRSIALAKQHVTATLPFKQKERMRRLKRIEGDLAVTHPDPARGLTRLWRFVEEEKALTREIGLSQQAIDIDGKRLLVEVARIGMAMMYFRLPSGQVGWARQVKDGWRFEEIETASAQSVVRKIFDDLKNNRVFGPKHLLIPRQLPQVAAGRGR